jgi:hypothetical protein
VIAFVRGQPQAAGDGRDHLLRRLRPVAAAVVVPPATRCVHALDAGPDSAPVLKDYTRLSPTSSWYEGAEFGWVGNTPHATDTGREVDLELSAEEDRTWHLSACVVLADDQERTWPDRS